MRILGIDYGSKRIGISLSDEGETLAFPHGVLESTKDSIDQIVQVVKNNGVEAIVMGASVDFQGKDNTIMGKIREFQRVLEQKLQIPVILEPEHLTSALARRSSEKNVIDAAAAALILQSYLDRQKGGRPS